RLAARSLIQLDEPRGRQTLEQELQAADVGVQLQASLLLCDLDSPLAQQKLATALEKGQVPESALLDVLTCLSQSGEGAAAYARLESLLRSARAPRAGIPIAARLAQLGDASARSYLRGFA